MFEAEAQWLERLLRPWGPEQLSPLLNVGSSTREFREVTQPHTDRHLFRPLRERGIKLVHLDSRDGDGIDIRADILSDADLPRIMAFKPKAILCCNILEHVREPERLARRCMEIVGPGGLIFVTVPRSYPHHRDPIDTMYRPAPDQLAELFRPATMLKGEIVDVGESYRGQVAETPLDFVPPHPTFSVSLHRVRGVETVDRKALLAGAQLRDHRRRVPGSGPRGTARDLLLSLTGGSIGFSTRPRLERCLVDRGSPPALFAPLESAG